MGRAKTRRAKDMAGSKACLRAGFGSRRECALARDQVRPFPAAPGSSFRGDDDPSWAIQEKSTFNAGRAEQPKTGAEYSRAEIMS